MICRASLWLPLLVAGTLAPAFTACAGTTDGLFSDAGGSDAGGAPNAGGTGAATATGGTSSTGGGSSSGGAHASGGATGGVGAASGSSAKGGASSTGGTGAASGSGTTAGSGNAGAGGNSGGHGGSSAGGSSSGGAGNAGASSGGSAGSGGTTCQELLALAESELVAAQACDLARNVQQCTGSVSTVCGCQVPVEANNSTATQTYLATLKSFRNQRCVIACSKIACLPNFGAQCQALDSGDRCVARVGATTQ